MLPIFVLVPRDQLGCPHVRRRGGRRPARARALVPGQGRDAVLAKGLAVWYGGSASLCVVIGLAACSYSTPSSASISHSAHVAGRPPPRCARALPRLAGAERRRRLPAAARSHSVRPPAPPRRATSSGASTPSPAGSTRSASCRRSGSSVSRPFRAVRQRWAWSSYSSPRWSSSRSAPSSSSAAISRCLSRLERVDARDRLHDVTDHEGDPVATVVDALRELDLLPEVVGCR